MYTLNTLNSVPVDPMIRFTILGRGYVLAFTTTMQGSALLCLALPHMRI
jgi:hypothetical protein